MDGGSVEGGISHPLFIPSSSHRERGGKASSFIAGLLQPHVHRLEGVGLVEIYNRPVPLEQVCSSNELQDGDQPVISPCSSGGQLNGLCRPEGCVSSGPCSSGKFLRFVAFGEVCQFKVLCFGLSTAPQVFTRVMVPV